jgi:hypothetical protein
MCVRFGQDTSDEKSRKFGSAAEENSRGKPTRGRDKEFLQLHNKRTACFLPLIKTAGIQLEVANLKLESFSTCNTKLFM